MKLQIIFISITLLIFLSPPVHAWELSGEGYWEDVPYTLSSSYVYLASFENGHAFYFSSTNYYGTLTINAPYTGYLGFTMRLPKLGNFKLSIKDAYGSNVYYQSVNPIPVTDYTVDHTVEVIENDDQTAVSIYVDDVEKYTVARGSSNDPAYIVIEGSASGGLYLDDFSSYPYMVAMKGFIDSTSNDVYFAAITQSVEDNTFYAQMSKSDGTVLKSWNLTSTRYIGSFSPHTDLGTDGLYYINIYDTSGAIYYSKQFVYMSDGVFPDITFLIETDTAADIRDENNVGGAVTGGGTVCLYPDTSEDGWYNISCDFSEQAYSRNVVCTKVYNTTELNGSIFSFSGLSTTSYNVSIDGNLAGQTNGDDTWSYNTTWAGNSTYEFDFEPDLSIPGVWGYVKNSETQAGVKSAHVTISNDTFSTTLDTDINGMYYTSGIVANESYTVNAIKSGYTVPASQTVTTKERLTTRQDFFLDQISTDGSGLYYAPHDVGFTVLEYWYSGAGLPGVSYTISSEDDGDIKTGTTDSKGMFTGSDMTGGINYTITLTYNGKTYTEYVEPSLTEYTFILNKEGVLHQYANSWLTLSYTENTNNVTIAYTANKTITGASLTAIANNGTVVYSQTLNTTTGSFTFETGGEGEYTLNFHIQATDGDTASQSWGLSYPSKVPLFPDSYPAWLKNILFSGIVIVFLLSFGKAKNDIACGSVAILTSMGYLFEWFTCSFYFVVLVWIIALGAVFLHYKRTGGIG